MKKKRSFLALAVALVMALSSAVMAPAAQETGGKGAPASYEESVLTFSLGEALGMSGFEGEYALTDPDAPVDIMVQFVTPPSVAIKLGAERGVPGFSAGIPAEEQALAAHAAFYEQLGSLGARSLLEIRGENHILFNGAFMTVPAGMVPEIAALGEVFCVYPERVYYTDTVFESAPSTAPGGGTGAYSPIGYNDESRALLGIEEINASGITGAGIKVGVLDSGINQSHTIFKKYLENGKIRGYNYIPNENGGVGSDNVEDINGHGSHVSGILISMAPDVELWHFRCLNQYCQGLTEWIIDACEGAYVNEMDVVNLSLGGILDYPMNYAFSYLAMEGTVVVVCCMNPIGSKYGDINPPAYVSALPIYVANSRMAQNGGENIDDINPSSGRGPTANSFRIGPDIAAPGTEIRSAMVGGINSYLNLTGTSMATPHIAGVAALILQKYPGISPSEVKSRIMNTARPITEVSVNSGYPDDVFISGAGFVRPREALENETVVTTEYNIEYPAQLGFNKTDKGYSVGPATMANFCFGQVASSGYPSAYSSVVRLLPVNNRSIPAKISNNGAAARTYTLESSFINNTNDAAALTLSPKTITVPAGGTGEFYATISAGGLVAKDNYFGFVYVKSEGETVARLPFSLLNNGYTSNGGLPTNVGTEVYVPAHKLSFDMGGAPAIDSIYVNENAAVLNFLSTMYIGMDANGCPAPAEGFMFKGWYLDTARTQPLTSSTAMTEPMTLYADFETSGEEDPFICGDLNDDGVVDMVDAILLSRYIAEWGNPINLLAADANDDGVVDMLDGIIMARHIAEWPGYEVLPVKQ